MNKKHYESKNFTHDDQFIYVNKILRTRELNFLDNHLLLKLELSDKINIDNFSFYQYKILNNKEYYNFELINNSINIIKKTKNIDYFNKVFKSFDNKYLKTLEQLEEDRLEEKKDIFEKYLMIKENFKKKIKL